VAALPSYLDVLASAADTQLSDPPAQLTTAPAHAARTAYPMHTYTHPNPFFLSLSLSLYVGQSRPRHGGRAQAFKEPWLLLCVDRCMALHRGVCMYAYMCMSLAHTLPLSV
jgi:hypothetical protein